MTLDEAIKHARDKANEQKCHSCKKCAEEHEQLADWLEELKNRRETNFNYIFCNFNIAIPCRGWRIWYVFINSVSNSNYSFICF